MQAAKDCSKLLILSIGYLGHRRGVFNEPVLDSVRVRHMGPGLAPCGDQARPGGVGFWSFPERCLRQRSAQRPQSTSRWSQLSC